MCSLENDRVQDLTFSSACYCITLEDVGGQIQHGVSLSKATFWDTEKQGSSTAEDSSVFLQGFAHNTVRRYQV